MKRYAPSNVDDDRGQPARSAFTVRKAEFRRYVRALDPRTPVARRFVLYAHYRTGSHLLTGLINGHPRVHCFGEVLVASMRPKPRPPLFPKLLLRGCFMSAPPDVQVCGINLKSDQLIRLMPRHEPAGLLHWLRSDGAQIIYLYRKNAVRQAVSDFVANARLRWSAPATSDTPDAPDAPDAKVVVDPTRLLGAIRWFEHERELEQRSLEDIPCLTLSYEDDLMNAAAQRATMRRIFEFLRVEQVEVNATTRRPSSGDLADSMANYDEVAKALDGTKYAAMLGEP